MLLPTKIDLISKNESCKWNLVKPSSSIGGKVVLILLTKVITLYIGTTTINIRRLSLELISR